MEIKKNNLVPYLMLVPAFIGIAIAFYDSFIIYNNLLLWCPPPIDGCNIVAYSPHAFIFKMPIGNFGLIYYLSMFVIAALLAYDPFSRGLRLATVLTAGLGMFISIYFMYIQINFIQAYCIYCLISLIMTSLLLISALAHFRATRSITSSYCKQHISDPAAA